MYSPWDTLVASTTIDGQTWVFTGNMEYENGVSISNGGIYNATMEKTRLAARKDVFGLGWSLDLPGLDVDGESLIWVNMPNGQMYKADFTKSTGLAEYELTDVVFSKDTTSGNGTEVSAYKLKYANGDAYYFSSGGELLNEVDRLQFH